MKKYILIVFMLLGVLAYSQAPIVDGTGYTEADSTKKTALVNYDNAKRWFVYDTDNNRFEYWDGDSWEDLGSGVTNIFNSDGITPDSSTRFFDLGLNSNFYLRNNDYSNYIWLNSFNLELRNSQGGLRFRTGTGGTIDSNNIGDVWTATSTTGDGHWETPSSGTTNLGYISTATNGTVTSSTGANAVIGLTNGSNAGLLSPSEQALINSALQISDLTNYVNVSGTQTITGQKTIDNGVNFKIGTTGYFNSDGTYVYEYITDSKILDFPNLFVLRSGGSQHFRFNNSTGAFDLYDYGEGNITGTATYGAAFNADGKLIEVPLSSGTDDQTMSEVPFTPYLTITATDGQTAVEELKDELDAAIIGVGTGATPISHTFSGGESSYDFGTTITTSSQIAYGTTTSDLVLLQEGVSYSKSGSIVTLIGFTASANDVIVYYPNIAVPTTYDADEVIETATRVFVTPTQKGLIDTALQSADLTNYVTTNTTQTITDAPKTLTNTNDDPDVFALKTIASGDEGFAIHAEATGNDTRGIRVENSGSDTKGILVVHTGINSTGIEIEGISTRTNIQSRAGIGHTGSLYTGLAIGGGTVFDVTKEGDVTANSFTKSGATSDDVLLGDGTTTSLAGIGDLEVIQIACSDLVTDLTTGTSKAYFRMPYAATLNEVSCSLFDAGTSTGLIVDINENGTSVLSTLLTTDATEETSETATTAAVISDSSLADDAKITIDFDAVPTSGLGVIVTLKVTRL